jgi:large subunit ribosomal protein L10
MPLTRAQKADIIEQIGEKLDGSPIIYLTNFSGLSVDQTNELRGRFREAGVDYMVTKNTLAQIALDKIEGMDALAEHFSGPTAVAFSDDPAKPARVLKDFLEDEDLERPELKVAYIEGDMYEGPEALEELAKLKSREELVGDVVGLLLGPAQTIAGSLQGPASTLAGAIKAIADGEGEGEGDDA